MICPVEEDRNAPVAKAAVELLDAGQRRRHEVVSDASGIPMRLPLFASFFAIASIAIARPPAAPAPVSKREAFFRGGTIPTLVLEFTKADADSLRRDHRKYVKCKLSDGDTVYRDVGVHLKGAAGSFRNFDDKPGLTLNVDKFTDGLRYRGMQKFHLANSLQDPSYLSELICGEIFRAAGVPASRIGHALVVINGRQQGLYCLKEGYDKEFLKTHFKNARGNFYDGGFLRDIDQPLELVHTKDDVADRKDLQALVAAARERDSKKRFEKLEKLLDLDCFISYMVVESLVWDWDSYPYKCNNYRVYHDPVKNKITFIPSGMDQMFWEPNGPALPNFGGMVAAGIISTPEGKKRYYARMRQIMQTVFKPADLVKRLNELEKRIQPALAGVDRGAAADYKNQVNRLREGIIQRARSIDAELKRMSP
jgi:spore coat protein H